MTPTIPEMRKLCEAATPEPWETGQVSWNEDGDVQYVLHGIKRAHIGDARFISSSRQFVPWAISRIEELEAALEKAAPFIGYGAHVPDIKKLVDDLLEKK